MAHAAAISAAMPPPMVPSAPRLLSDLSHRRSFLTANGRTRLINQVRAILLERGITVAKGRRAFGLALATRADDEGSGLSETRPARERRPKDLQGLTEMA